MQYRRCLRALVTTARAGVPIRFAEAGAWMQYTLRRISPELDAAAIEAALLAQDLVDDQLWK